MLLTAGVPNMKRAHHDPDDIVLIGSEQVFTVKTLHAQVLLCAEQLLTAGITSLALHADNSPKWIIVDLACKNAKIRLVPLPLFFSAGQQEHSLEKQRCRRRHQSRENIRQLEYHRHHLLKIDKPDLPTISGQQYRPAPWHG